MVEKICEIIDDEYCCDIDITVEEWKELLEIKNKIHRRGVTQWKY
jgi:5-methylcytosine-specific restriction protein A